MTDKRKFPQGVEQLLEEIYCFLGLIVEARDSSRSKEAADLRSRIDKLFE